MRNGSESPAEPPVTAFDEDIDVSQGTKKTN
jgi:hypothetical protein